MSKQSLLLVDGDARSLRVLEVSLRKAGFTVTTAINGPDALDKLAVGTPDLVISETKLEDMDGYELCRRIKANPIWADIPFVFLTAQTGIEHKVKGLELGVDDYLTKPIYIKEVVTRLQILLQKRQRTRIEEHRDGRTRFVGRLSDMAVVDLIQTIEISRKSGVIQFTGENGRQAAIYFRDGKVVDAEAGPLQGEDAVYRLLTWADGSFEVVFRTVRRRDAITTPSQGLLMEGMRRLDEWTRLLEQLPPLAARFEVDTRELSARLGEIPDENNAILKLLDGRRTLQEVIDASSVGDLECLQALARLYFEGLLVESIDGRAERAPAFAAVAVDSGVRKPSATGTSEDSSQWVVPATVFDETPVEAERVGQQGLARGSSGPIPLARVVTVPPKTEREGAGARTTPPPAPGTRPPLARTGGSGPIPVPRGGSGSGPVPAAAARPGSGSGPIKKPGSGPIPPQPGTGSGPLAVPRAATAPTEQVPVVSTLESARIAAVADPTLAEAGAVTAPMDAAAFTESGRIAAPPADVDLSELVFPDELFDKPRGTPPPPAEATEPAPADEWKQASSVTPAVNLVSAGAGSFRPSGMRLVDEAVLAAQAIAPELVADLDDPVPTLPKLGARAEARPPDFEPNAFSDEPDTALAIPQPFVENDDDTSRPERMDADLEAAARRVEESGLRRLRGDSGARVVASHGADVAQVSGEFSISTEPPRTTERELVTIKPRRITRELPAVIPPDDDLPAGAAPAVAAAAPTASAAASDAATSDRLRESGRLPRPGTGTSRATASFRTPNLGRPSVGWMPWIFAALGVALLSAAYVRCRRAADTPATIPATDAAWYATVTPDAATTAIESPDAAAAMATPDAPPARRADAAPRPDAAPPRVDAPPRRPDAGLLTPRVDARPTPVVPSYRDLRRKAEDALADSDYETAIELADRSLALRKGARTYKIKADALRRLGRTDEALSAIDAALDMEPRFAPGWELRGRILWGAGKKDEARTAWERYLELEPSGAAADRIRGILEGN